MSKKFWIILGIIAAVLVGFLLFRGNDANAPSDGNVPAATHIRGNPDSTVVLTEYADFQCPYCAAFYPTVEQVVEKYKDDIRFEFRNLPLVAAHPNAFAAARAAEAAGKQDKYWEMVEILFANQNAWKEATDPRPTFDQYAKQLGLDAEQFNTDFGSSEVNNIINDDVAAFNATGEQLSTPTFFLNGQRLTLNDATVEEFSTHIDQALANQ